MVLCLDEIQVGFGWNKCRWGDGVMQVTEMERVWCG